MAIRGDTLFVADIRCVRIANRNTAEIAETRCLDNVTSLSGIDVGPEGSLFLTDSGYRLADGQPAASSMDALYRVTFRADQRGATLALGPNLNHPTGVAVGSRGIFVTTEGGDLLRFTADGQRTSLIASPGQIFEGIVFVAGGGFAYASSSAGAVYLVDGSGAVRTLIDGISSPGDLGYDPTRNRVLIPLFNENRLLFVDL
jgi:sugar lactone lactonase YvrE